MIPIYILIVRYLQMKDTILALILPTLLSPWYIMLMRTFMRSIPTALIEAARIDGAGDFTIYARVVIPLSKTALATVGLFIALSYWNDWYLASLYINDEALYPLQYLLYQMLSSAEFLKNAASAGFTGVRVQAPTETLKLATAVGGDRPDHPSVPVCTEVFHQGRQDRFDQGLNKAQSGC